MAHKGKWDKLVGTTNDRDSEKLRHRKVTDEFMQNEFEKTVGRLVGAIGEGEGVREKLHVAQNEDSKSNLWNTRRRKTQTKTYEKKQSERKERKKKEEKEKRHTQL